MPGKLFSVNAATEAGGRGPVRRQRAAGDGVRDGLRHDARRDGRRDDRGEHRDGLGRPPLAVPREARHRARPRLREGRRDRAVPPGEQRRPRLRAGPRAARRGAGSGHRRADGPADRQRASSLVRSAGSLRSIGQDWIRSEPRCMSIPQTNSKSPLSVGVNSMATGSFIGRSVVRHVEGGDRHLGGALGLDGAREDDAGGDAGFEGDGARGRTPSAPLRSRRPARRRPSGARPGRRRRPSRGRASPCRRRWAACACMAPSSASPHAARASEEEGEEREEVSVVMGLWIGWGG